MRKARAKGAAGLIVALMLAACGGTTAPTTTETAPTTTEPEENVVEITMVDFDFHGVPASIPAGSRLTVVNEADFELHEVVLFRLPADESRSAEELSTLSPHDLEHAFGGPPIAVLLAAPGGPQIPAVGDGVVTEPGNYVIFCFIPTGVDPQVYLDAAAESEGGPPVIDDAGPPHFVHGMFAEFTVP